jgi:deferrochelatase/peroxidase EfeB
MTRLFSRIHQRKIIHEDQQRTIGRDKLTGAPLGSKTEFDPVKLSTCGHRGETRQPLCSAVLRPVDSESTLAAMGRCYEGYVECARQE